MKRTISLLFFLLSASICIAQVEVKGTIISNEDGLGIPSAKILELGTKNETLSDLEGNFHLTVSNPNATLEISFIGFITKKIELKGQNSISVTLKPDCNIDFFDSQSISIYSLVGINYNPIGGQIDFAFPNFSKGTLIPGIAFQSNLKGNHFLNGKLEYKHFIFNCDFDLDLNWYHRRVNFNDFNSVTNSFETSFNYGNFRLTAGYSNLNFSNLVSDATQNFSAPVVGVGTWINTKPVRTLISGKVALYGTRKEVITQATFYTKYFELFVNYYDLDSFSQLTIGIGKTFGYLNKSQKQFRQQQNNLKSPS
ncbi:carboxypeptidase-like regulatory domain-containing protein [Algoriphagus sp. CAU 1675]|uniref:carboxypeptidase-like regulatory domain-containing protein n=1 Tax=Algoriphagus sp. CAU 1675 TaxID=3032597 RepID=UPI0023DA0CF0|nr:carboxypeptidase-like regulatory domain-containing protein [Algoriphagus sp. CAU 1675]MDF2157652.1 carboxypeptidase-like regulatory domain-containing protein [Algoriphagus sp. CAU 1675]